MIKARMGKMIIFGLSDENIANLKQDKPIKIDGKELGFEGEVLIFYKPTTGDLIKTIQPFISEGTAIDDRLE